MRCTALHCTALLRLRCWCSQLMRQVVDTVKPEFRMVGAVALVAGIPNVGKSTLINAVREQHRDVDRVKNKRSKGA